MSYLEQLASLKGLDYLLTALAALGAVLWIRLIVGLRRTNRQPEAALMMLAVFVALGVGLAHGFGLVARPWLGPTALLGYLPSIAGLGLGAAVARYIRAKARAELPSRATEQLPS